MDQIDRILGIDIGTKRIGVAVSDPFGLFSSEVCLIERKTDKRALQEIEDLCKKYNTKKILIGIPYNMDGTLGFQAQNCIDFIRPLRDNYEIIEWDERLSSYEAEELLKKEKKKFTKNKGLVDIKSACLILQDYLNRKR